MNPDSITELIADLHRRLGEQQYELSFAYRTINEIYEIHPELKKQVEEWKIQQSQNPNVRIPLSKIQQADEK